jgi:thioredoxin reductase (NADPH)
MGSPIHHKVIIIGNGPAGYTAAIYTARANLNPAIITGPTPGGQLMTTTEIDNWPGEPAAGLTGPGLMDRMQQHAERFKVNMIYDTIVEVNLKNKPFYLKGESDEYTCDALIIATGASAKYLGLPSEEAYKGKGVCACATCDGPFYKGKKVAVIGGGNSAVTEAIFLSGIASHVTVINIGDEFKCEKILIDKLINLSKTANVTFELSQETYEILGNGEEVTGIKLKHLKTGEKKEIPVDGVFIAIGHTPNTSIFEGQLKMTRGYIDINKTGEGPISATSVPGVFSAGDVTDHSYQQGIIAAGSGCKAALDVEKYLSSFE